MKLNVAHLEGGEHEFRFESTQDGWLKDVVQHVEKQGYKLSGPMYTDMKLTKLEPDYYLRGKLRFVVGQTCARCAENFQMPVEHNFDVALAHVSTSKVARAKLSEESEELDINFFEGEEIDIGPLVEEQFFLSIPYQSLCQTDCKGICQHCGKNRNAGACSCQEKNPLHPFQVLQNFKL